MTVDEVKRDLPMVPVRTASGKRYMAKLSGRRCPYATVTLSMSYGKTWIGYHFSWEDVARAITTNEPLNLE